MEIVYDCVYVCMYMCESSVWTLGRTELSKRYQTAEFVTPFYMLGRRWILRWKCLIITVSQLHTHTLYVKSHLMLHPFTSIGFKKDGRNRVETCVNFISRQKYHRLDRGEAGVQKGWYADFYVINDVIYDIIFYASGYAGVYKNSLDSEWSAKICMCKK